MSTSQLDYIAETNESTERAKEDLTRRTNEPTLEMYALRVQFQSNDELIGKLNESSPRDLFLQVRIKL